MQPAKFCPLYVAPNLHFPISFFLYFFFLLAICVSKLVAFPFILSQNTATLTSWTFMYSRLNVFTIYLPSLTTEPLQIELKLVGLKTLSHPSHRGTFLLFLQLKLELEFAIHINATLSCLDVVSTTAIHSTRVLSVICLQNDSAIRLIVDLKPGGGIRTRFGSLDVVDATTMDSGEIFSVVCHQYQLSITVRFGKELCCGILGRICRLNIISFIVVVDTTEIHVAISHQTHISGA